ncbi:MAG: PHA/PHB synthase family protein, partial [Rhizomicrobium sp.]
MSDVTTEAQLPKKFDPEAFALNLARAMENSGQALAAYLKPRGEVVDKPPNELTEIVKTFTAVAEYWLSDNDRSADLQAKLAKAYLDLWGSSVRRLAGEAAPPAIAPSPRDKRFADPEWKSNQFFDFLMQFYLLSTQWAHDLVRNAEGVDPHTRKKAEFYVQQITNALAPSNFVLTNPEVLRETLSSNGDNLVRGMKMLKEDIEAGHGSLRIRQSDPANLAVGVNMATTPGKVIFQNELMQLIQYTASTENVLRTPLLIVPPWINKFYILDLKPEKSFIKWCVDQGITVFVISWVNPDKSLGAKTFEDYMKAGPLAAMDVIERATGELKVHTMGYCVGGTLLASTLAWLAEKRRVRVTSATFLAAQVDFSHAGDLLVFVDEDQITALERDMQAAGVLEGSKMAMAFNMLRSNDLIWSYVISNYLKGQPPSAFDLLHWNSDATRMPAANHAFYMRQCYLNNTLSGGKMTIDNVHLDLKKVTV